MIYKKIKHDKKSLEWAKISKNNHDSKVVFSFQEKGALNLASKLFGIIAN